MIKAWINGTPKGQPRPRAFARNGRARMYDPGTAEAWKSSIAAALEGKIPAKPMTGPVIMTAAFYMPRPRAHYGTGKRAEELRADAPRLHTSKPDIDNLVKAVMDALSTLGVWRDDAQVASQTAYKRYSGKPGCMLIVSELPNAQVRHG
jgi:Holliday junction resolvase RusA-like endonuclease